jgi:predicted transcriptional regulator
LHRIKYTTRFAESQAKYSDALAGQEGGEMHNETSDEKAGKIQLTSMDEEDTGADKAMTLTVDLVRAYVTNHTVPAAQLAKLIKQTHRTVTNLTNLKPEPSHADLIRSSIKPSCIVCLEDGKEFRSLKRHLAAQHGVTPAEYRARWNLPSDYPMVAPDYSAFRSEVAIAMRLGQQRTNKSKSD